MLQLISTKTVPESDMFHNNQMLAT